MSHNVFILNWCNWTLSRRTNSKCYNIIVYFVPRFEFWLKYLFFLFHFAFILSHLRATCPHKKCVHTIYQFFIIKIYINKVTFLYFFFLFFLLFKMIFVDARRKLLLCITKSRFFSYIMKHSLINFMLTAKTLWRL